MLSSVSFSACAPIGLNYPYDPNFVIEQNLMGFADGFGMYLNRLKTVSNDLKQFEIPGNTGQPLSFTTNDFEYPATGLALPGGAILRRRARLN